MSEKPHPIVKLLKDDPRFTLDAYEFVRDALSFAHETLEMGEIRPVETELIPGEKEPIVERHLTGQQLSEAIRQYALEQYGYMSKVVLNSWGLKTTGDFGEIVYNLIDIGLMKKSEDDQRKDFEDVYDFNVAFQQQYQIDKPE